ncbi:MAG: 5'-methylthioadenosine phosphorylase, partial [Betaproteobacteria bacterium]
IAVVANHAAGRGGGAGISLSDIAAVLEQAMGKVRPMLAKLVASDGG